MDNIKLFTFDDNIALQKEFYFKTELSYSFCGREVLSKRKNEIRFNDYCPFDEAKKYISFYGIHLSAMVLSDLNENDIDTDFDIGINNLECDLENELLQYSFRNFKDKYFLIRVSNPRNDYKMIHFIENNYNIVFFQELSQHIYIIKYTKVQLINVNRKMKNIFS